MQCATQCFGQSTTFVQNVAVELGGFGKAVVGVYGSQNDVS
jgi:hypothetical protein